MLKNVKLQSIIYKYQVENIERNIEILTHFKYFASLLLAEILNSAWILKTLVFKINDN